jgi:phosphoribosylaminoimidazole-succinocarboxamide synthase
VISEELIQKNLSNTLEKTNFFSNKITGKVRDSYNLGDKRLIVTTDRISAFDVVLTTIPFKGQILNQLSAFWFKETEKVFPNHVIAVPDPNVLVAKNANIFPIEFVVRGYITGSAWRDYTEGKSISGIKLPSGLRNWERFEEPIITPSTKAEQGLHDEPISREEIFEKKIVEKNVYEKMEKAALALFRKGQELALENGLLLVDTKYEFGVSKDGELMVCDEMHTPDSSRYWFSKTYKERFEQGIEPEILDKEYLRQWLIKEKNFMGKGTTPQITDEVRAEVSKRYIQAFELITGKKLEVTSEPVLVRIERNLKEKGHL